MDAPLPWSVDQVGVEVGMGTEVGRILGFRPMPGQGVSQLLLLTLTSHVLEASPPAEPPRLPPARCPPQRPGNTCLIHVDIIIIAPYYYLFVYYSNSMCVLSFSSLSFVWSFLCFGNYFPTGTFALNFLYLFAQNLLTTH